jgi:hypothetical protein
MEEKYFPGLYQASNQASLLAQKTYKNIIGYDLITMIVASALAIYNYQSTDPKLAVYIISGFFLLTGLVLTIIVKSKKYEDVWYQGRALAESCKTLTWRFITCSESFEVDKNLEEAKTSFVKRLKELGAEFKELNSNLNAKTLTLPNISNEMLNVRNSTMQQRKEYYIQHRIEDQKKWYATKAEFNKGKYNLWFIIIIAVQAVALMCAIYLITNPESNWNFVGLFTTISACGLSWLQLKQHQELKQAYTTAAQELNFILDDASKVDTEAKLSKFILDSENAISREHTLWLAQKRT